MKKVQPKPTPADLTALRDLQETIARAARALGDAGDRCVELRRFLGPEVLREVESASRATEAAAKRVEEGWPS